jgi:putative copper resistance protein D
VDPSVALDLCRFLHDAAVMLLWGASAYLALLVPARLGAMIGRLLWGWGAAAVVLATTTAIVALPLETAVIGNGWKDAVASESIRAVLFESTVGQAWLAEAGTGVLLILAAVSPMRRALTIMIASGLMLASLALTGHAAMYSGWLGAAHRANDAIHVLAGGAWLGALVPLLPIITRLNQEEWRTETATALMRFSFAGHVAVTLVLITGVCNTILILGHWPTDPSSPYEAMLNIKIVLVGLMVLLASTNRYVFMPRLAARPAETVRSVRNCTMAEIGLGLGVVALVSVFGMLDPA